MTRPIWWIFFVEGVRLFVVGSTYFGIRRWDWLEAWRVSRLVARTCREVRHG